MPRKAAQGRPQRASVFSGSISTSKPRHIYLHDDEWKVIVDAAEAQGRTISAQIAHMAKALRQAK